MYGEREMSDGKWTTYYAALMRPGSRRDPAKPVREQPHRDEHAAYMDGAFAKGYRRDP